MLPIVPHDPCERQDFRRRAAAAADASVAIQEVGGSILGKPDVMVTRFGVVPLLLHPFFQRVTEEERKINMESLDVVVVVDFQRSIASCVHRQGWGFVGFSSNT